MKKILLKFVAMMCFVVLCFPNVKASAAESAAVFENYTAEEQLVLYVKGVSGEVKAVSYQIGNTACDVAEYSKLSATEEPIYTLILWDNSISVMKEYSADIKEVLLDIVANRAANELIAVATLERDVAVQSEYTNDYATLKKLINDVNGINKSVYIVNNLYRCLEAFNEMDTCDFKRVIVISDGIGEDNTGYTMSELDALLAEHPYPIHTIGVGTDEKDLQNLFSLARTTGAGAFHLDKIKDKLEVSEQVAEDYEAIQVKVLLPEELRDGSTRNSRVTVEAEEGAYQAECQVKLPFLSAESGTEGVVTDPTEEQNPAETPDFEQDVEGEDNGNTEENEDDEDEEEGWFESLDIDVTYVILFGAGGLLLVVAVIVLVLVLRKRKKENERAFEEEPVSSYFDYDKMTENVTTFYDNTNDKDPLDDTVVLGQGTGDETIAVRRQTEGYQLQLTSVEDAAVTYRCNSSTKILIGRDALRCNIAISGDRTVSSSHCEVFRIHDRFFIKDAGSTNGTQVNGTTITMETEIKNGSIVKIGSKEYRVTIG
ncbi:MAG: FHA domain-containing protein [Lachnospiraceae bacterium]|nr:FHA domain-containing protein [Lachnospiraceae bacterium]